MHDVEERRLVVVGNDDEPVRQVVHERGDLVVAEPGAAGDRATLGRLRRECSLEDHGHGRPLARQQHDPARRALDHVRVEVVEAPVRASIDARRRAPPPAQRLPEQVGIGEQEAEGNGGQRREAAHVGRRGEDQRAPDQRRHGRERPERAQCETVCGGEEDGEEEDVRRAEVRSVVLAGDAEGDRDVVEEVRLLLDDVLRRAAPDGDRVDERNDRGDQNGPGDGLEPGEEPEAEQDESEELREVEEDVELGQAQEHGERAEREPGGEQRGRLAERQQQPRDPERRGEEDEREEEEVRPEAGVPEMVGSGRVRRERGRQRRQRGPAPVAQYGGSSAYHAPTALKAFQKAVLAGASSSALSMSGTTSASIVAVKRCRPGTAGSIASASGKKMALTNSTVASPIGTSSFGWTMWSSRVSQGAASSKLSPPNL